MDSNKDVGLRLKKARNAKGWTQEELSEKTGIKRTTITNYEKGKYSISAKNRIILCNILGISVSELFANVENSSPVDEQTLAENTRLNDLIEELRQELKEAYKELSEARKELNELLKQKK